MCFMREQKAPLRAGRVKGPAGTVVVWKQCRVNQFWQPSRTGSGLALVHLIVYALDAAGVILPSFKNTSQYSSG